MPQLFASALEDKNIKDLLMTFGSPGAAAAAPSVPSAVSAPASTQPEKKEEKPVEESESEGDMGFGLFD